MADWVPACPDDFLAFTGAAAELAEALVAG